MPAAAGFLRTRFVELERTAFDIQAVEFSDDLGRVIFRPEFDESVPARAACSPIRDDAGRDRLIALPGKQLQQALIGNAIRQTFRVRRCHMPSSILTGSSAHRNKQATRLAETSLACYAVGTLNAFGCVVRSLWFSELI
jgi:hypothetical protein